MIFPDYLNYILIASFAGLIFGFILRSYVHSIELISNSNIRSSRYLIYLCLWDIVERSIRYLWFFLFIGALTIFLFIAMSFPESVTTGISLTGLGPKLVGPFCLTLFCVFVTYELLVFLYVIFFADRPFKKNAEMESGVQSGNLIRWKVDPESSIWNAELTDFLLKYTGLNLAHEIRGLNLRQYTWGIYDQRYEVRSFGSILFSDELVFCGSLRRADNRLLANTMLSEISRLSSFDWIPSIPYLIFDILNAFRSRFGQRRSSNFLNAIAYYLMFPIAIIGSFLSLVEKLLTKNREFIRDAHVCQFGYWDFWYAVQFYRTYGEVEFEKTFNFSFAEIDQWVIEASNLSKIISTLEEPIFPAKAKSQGAPSNVVHQISKQSLGILKDFLSGLLQYKSVNYSSIKRLRWIAVYGLGLGQNIDLNRALFKVWIWPRILKVVLVLAVGIYVIQIFRIEAPKYRKYEIPKKLQEYESKIGIQN